MSCNLMVVQEYTRQITALQTQQRQANLSTKHLEEIGRKIAELEEAIRQSNEETRKYHEMLDQLKLPHVHPNILPA